MSDRVVPVFSQPPSWSSTVGLFLLNFGALEMQTFDYLEKHLPAAEFAKWKERSLKERVARIGELLANSDERRTAFTAFAQQLEPVRELRNHIAHGFLQMVIKPADQGHVMAITQAKDLNAPFAPETRHLEFVELQTNLMALDHLIIEFSRLTR